MSRSPLLEAVGRARGGLTLVLLLGGCGDGGSGPTPGALVPRLVRLTPNPNPSPGESGILIDLEVRSQAGAPEPNVLVSWEVTRGAVLSPALTDTDGELQALWVFTRATDPMGTAAQVRACARREPSDPCAYSVPADVVVP